MRGPSLQKTAAVSVLLHLTILVLSVVLINYSKNVVMPSPYTVSLVSPSKGRSSGERVQKIEEPKSTPVEKAKSPEESKEVTKTDKKADEKILNKKLAALKTKTDAIDKLARKNDIRKRIAEISGKAGTVKSTSRPTEKQGAAGGQKGIPTDMYIAKISDAIWREWHWPEMGKKDLEAVVSVTIRRDGSIKINNFEKRSGDLFFDKSVLKAITNASPVTPPLYEMEIGIRFTP
jgi:TolA protein